MYFSNPAIIKDWDDVKLGMVETDLPEMSYNELLGHIKNELEDKITFEAKSVMVESPDLSYEDALQLVADRTFRTLDFYERKNINDASDLAEALMNDTSQMAGWKNRILIRFKQTHHGAVEADTQIKTTGVVELPEKELTYLLKQGGATYPEILELLRCMLQ